MIRTLVCAVAALLLVGVLFAEDEKPAAKGDSVKEKSPEAVKKEGKDETKNGDPETKGDVLKGKSPEGVKKEGKEGLKKGDPEAKKVPTEKGIKKEGKKSDGGGQKGLLNKIGIESGVVKLSVNGKEYEFPVNDNTVAFIRTEERDGKQVVMGIQLANATEGKKKGGDKTEMKKKEGQNSDERPIEKPKEKSPE